MQLYICMLLSLQSEHLYFAMSMAANISSMAKQIPTVTTLLLLFFFILRGTHHITIKRVSFFLVFDIYSCYIVVEVEGAERLGEVKLFVFGDSYVDTGNLVNSISYKPPSGITFPGTPAGRFSNGCVLTDYIGTSSSLHFCHRLLTNFRAFFCTYAKVVISCILLMCYMYIYYVQLHF